MPPLARPVDGPGDVELIEPGEDLSDGRWRFTFHRPDKWTVHELDVWRDEDDGKIEVCWGGLSYTEPQAGDWEGPWSS